MASDFTLGFLIAPTRGSNMLDQVARWRLISVPHRPYEGQQHACERCMPITPRVPHRPYEGQQLGPLRWLWPQDGVRFLIAPTRGSNTASRARYRDCVTVPHRPYEGQQRQ